MIKLATIRIPSYVYEFYQKVGMVSGLSAERVMGEALFKLAGEMSLNVIDEKEREKNEGFS